MNKYRTRYYDLIFILKQEKNFLERMKEQISYEILKLNFYSRTRRKLS